MWEIRQFFRNIKRIVKWIPRLWNNEDWDYQYSVDVLKYKLSDIADHIEKHKRHENWEHYVSRIRTTIRLMEKVYGDQDYEMDGYDQIEKLYGKKNFDWFPVDEHLKQLKISFEKKYTDEELEVIKKQEKFIHKEYAAKQKKAHALVWKMIEHNLYDWWD